MRVAIVGSRDYPRLDLVKAYVFGLPSDTVVVSGRARGVDQTAEDAARQALTPEPIIHVAEWDRLGRRAGYVRNELIVRDAERVVAFQAYGSRGTQHTINIARRAGKPVLIYDENGDVRF